MVHVYKCFLLTTHDQDQIITLILQTDPGIDISVYSLLIFYYPNPFRGL